MSQDNEKLIIVGALLFGAYMYTRRAAAPVAYQAQPRPGAVGTMPGSAGTGWQQIGAAALTGFLGTVASGIQNGAYGNVPSMYNGAQAATDWAQSGTVQDVADSFGDIYGSWA